MTRPSFLLVLTATSPVLTIFLTGVYGNDGLQPNVFNCTGDQECQLNWVCKGNPLKACAELQWSTENHEMKCFYFSDSPSECARVPEMLNLSLSEDSFSAGSVTMKLSLSRGPFPYHLAILFGLRPRYGDRLDDGVRLGVQSARPEDNYTEISMRFNDLWGATEYTAYYAMASAAGFTPTYGPYYITTSRTRPGTVKNLKAVEVATSSTRTILTYQCPDNLGGKITHIIVRKRRFEGRRYTDFEYHIPNEGTCLNHTDADHVGGIENGKRYSFKVKLKNEQYEGYYSDPVELSVKDKNDTSLIIGLSVGIGGGLIIVASVVGFLYYRQNKTTNPVV